MSLGNGKIQRLIYKIKPPCSKCPYKLGFVHALVNPCPQCKENNYSTYNHFCDNPSRYGYVPKQPATDRRDGM